MKKHKKQLNQEQNFPEPIPAATQTDEDFARVLAAMFEAELGPKPEDAKVEEPSREGQEQSAATLRPSVQAPDANPESTALFRAIDALLDESEPEKPVSASASSEIRSPAPETEAAQESASLQAEPEPEESPRSRRKALRAQRKAERRARKAASVDTERSPVQSASDRSEAPAEAEDRPTSAEPAHLDLPPLPLHQPDEERSVRKLEPLKPVPSPASPVGKASPFTMKFETIRIPEVPENNPAAAETPALKPEKSVSAATEAEEDIWSDEHLFDAVDRVLAHSIFSGAEQVRSAPDRERSSEPAAPEAASSSAAEKPSRKPPVSADTKRMDLSAVREEGLSSLLTVPSAETLMRPGRGPLIDTEPLPSLEELFPSPSSPEAPAPEPEASTSAPEPETAPAPEPETEPEPESQPAPEEAPAAAPEPAETPAAQAQQAARWEELPSSQELFGRSPREDETEEPPDTGKTATDRKQKKNESEPRRRRFGSWLAELLHPKFTEPQEEEPVLLAESELSDEPLPMTLDTLPDQLPLEGFGPAEYGADDSTELPDQLPLLGFTADSDLPEPASPPDRPTFSTLPETPPTPPAPERQSLTGPSFDPEEETEEGDGPDLIPQVRNKGAEGGRNRRGALSLRELLASAVPIEEAEPPLGSSRQRTAAKSAPPVGEETVSVPSMVPGQIATVPENPAGLIRKQTPAEPAKEAPTPKPRRKPEPAPRPAPASQKPQPKASPVPDRPEGGSAKDVEKVFRMESSARAKSSAPDNNPTPTSNEPVPSASVRTNRERARALSQAQASHAEAQPSRPETQPSRPRSAERSHPAPIRQEVAILHPEEAYRKYARSVSTLGSRMVLTGLFTVLSLFLTLYLSLQWKFLPEIFSGGTSTYVLLALLLAMVFTNFSLYLDAVKSLAGKKRSPDLLILLATVFTALDTFQAAKALRPQFTAVIGLLLLISLWGKYDLGMALITTVKVLREEDVSVGVSEVPDITKGSRGLTRTEPDVDQFMEKLETRSLCERVISVYTPIAALAGLVLTFLVSFGLHRDLFWSGSLIMIGTVPLTALMAFPRLFLLLAQRLSAARTALCGYHGAEIFGGDHAILIGDDDIFPQGSLNLNGFKVYNGNPDRIIAYAAAATRSSGSALAPLFEDLLRTHVGRRYNVDAFRFYDSGGIGATIIGDVVLMGSLDFMRRMGVHMDKGSKVRQAVYLSINGELAAVFAVKYTAPENLRRGLAALANNRHFKGILVTRTFLGTPSFLKAKFGIPIGSFTYPSTKERLRLSEAELKHSGAQGAILAEDSFSGFAQAAAGGRTLRSASVLATVLSLLAGSVGLLLTAVLAALPAYETATAVNLLLFEAAWLAPTLLLSGWTRHF